MLSVSVQLEEDRGILCGDQLVHYVSSHHTVGGCLSLEINGVVSQVGNVYLRQGYGPCVQIVEACRVDSETPLVSKSTGLSAEGQ